MAKWAPGVNRVHRYLILAKIKSLLTLLELTGSSLHDQKNHGRDARPQVWTGMAASETGSAAWPGRLPGGGSTVSVIVATAIVVPDMVGGGGLPSPGFHVKDIPSGLSVLFLWAV